MEKIESSVSAADGDFLYSTAKSKYRKRPDVIARAIKEWMVENRKKPGDRLPKEKELMGLFKAGKGVIRETLKSMEVQGLVTISTGPRGGAVLHEVPEETAMGLLGNYFFFQQFEVKEIYEMSKVLEPTLSAGVVGHLTPEHFEALDEIVTTCSRPARTREESRTQLMAEVRFHEILADACPNSFLSFFLQVHENHNPRPYCFQVQGHRLDRPKPVCRFQSRLSPETDRRVSQRGPGGGVRSDESSCG